MPGQGVHIRKVTFGKVEIIIISDNIFGNSREILAIKLYVVLDSPFVFHCLYVYAPNANSASLFNCTKSTFANSVHVTNLIYPINKMFCA